MRERMETKRGNMRNMATIQLKHLTIPRLVDAAFLCGRDKQPVFLHIAGDPGIGKTYSTKSIKAVHGVTYFSASYSPNEYKGHIKEVSKHTMLFIHDDVGRGNPSYTKDFISAFCDICEGHTEYRQYRKNLSSDFNFSGVFTSTTAWFYNWKDVMQEMGYLDRVLPIQVELHPDTEVLYRNACMDAALEGCLSNEPALRKITDLEKHDPMELYSMKVAPRNLRNILRLSCYLSREEMLELIAVIQADKPKYSI